MHPLAQSAAESGSQADVVISVEGIGTRLDVEMTGAESLTLDQVRSLARRVDAAYGAAGGRADAWRNAAIGTLAAHERDLLAGSGELPMINVDDNTRVLASRGAGSRTSRERPFWERYRGRGR